MSNLRHNFFYCSDEDTDSLDEHGDGVIVLSPGTMDLDLPSAQYSSLDHLLGNTSQSTNLSELVLQNLDESLPSVTEGRTYHSHPNFYIMQNAIFLSLYFMKL